jgi:flagellar hook-basal body complex protein FliE
MAGQIDRIGKSYFLRQYEKAGGERQKVSQTFQELLDRYRELNRTSTEETQAVLVGQPVESHDVMIAAQEASLAFELILEVRNKLVEAYQELMRMQF